MQADASEPYVGATVCATVALVLSSWLCIKYVVGPGTADESGAVFAGILVPVATAGGYFLGQVLEERLRALLGMPLYVPPAPLRTRKRKRRHD